MIRNITCLFLEDQCIFSCSTGSFSKGRQPPFSGLQVSELSQDWNQDIIPDLQKVAKTELFLVSSVVLRNTFLTATMRRVFTRRSRVDLGADWAGMHDKYTLTSCVPWSLWGFSFIVFFREILAFQFILLRTIFENRFWSAISLLEPLSNTWVQNLYLISSDYSSASCYLTFLPLTSRTQRWVSHRLPRFLPV